MVWSALSRRTFLETISTVGGTTFCSKTIAMANEAEAIPPVNKLILLFIGPVYARSESGNICNTHPVYHTAKNESELNDALYSYTQQRPSAMNDNYLPLANSYLKPNIVTKKPYRHR